MVIVAYFEQTKPYQVQEALKNCCDTCQYRLEISQNDEERVRTIMEQHLQFERIHPFGDGNGRVGRAIMFKECLRKNIVPFVILDQHKVYYLRGLKEYDRDKNFLIDTCLNEQDIYKDLCKQLLNMNFENGKTR